MNMLQLSSRVLTGLLLLLSQTSFAASHQSWNFNVYLGDKLIGQHQFDVFTRNKTRYISVDATFNVRVLFFNAYHYQHNNNEVWQGQCLHSIRSTTDDNGDREFVEGTRENGVLQLRTASGSESLGGCIRTFAYWDPAILKSKQLLNAQTGELMPVQVKSLGQDQIDVRGRQVSARQYRLITSKFSIDLWYSPQQEWLALKSTTQSGDVLHYKLQ
jgi:hypothetical protein